MANKYCIVLYCLYPLVCRVLRHRTLPFNITITMILFNSAVNPFDHALLNQQFREKMNIVTCLLVLL